MLQFLVVDDDDAVSEVLKTGLEEYCGAMVTCANSGQGAMEKIKAAPPDLAVIDVVLPDMSGFALAEWAAARNVAVLLISGHLDRQASCKLYGYPHLAKPFRLKVLASAAKLAMADTSDNIARVRRSHAQLMATADHSEL